MTRADEPATAPTSLRLPTERRRTMLSAAAGAATAALAATFTPWQLATLAGFTVAAASFAAWTWRMIRRLDATQTRRFATRVDESRAAAGGVVVASCLASLVGVCVAVVQSREQGGVLGAALLVTAVLAVVAGWCCVDLVFTLRYAHVFHDDGGGLEFAGDGEPCFADFAYVAFTVGMTFQVSDTDVRSPAMRRLVLRHSLLAYTFGTAIIGLTINLLGGLLG